MKLDYIFKYFFRVSFNRSNNKKQTKRKEVFTEKTLREHRYKVRYLMTPRFSYNNICDKKCKIKGGKKMTANLLHS